MRRGEEQSRAGGRSSTRRRNRNLQIFCFARTIGVLAVTDRKQNRTVRLMRRLATQRSTAAAIGKKNPTGFAESAQYFETRLQPARHRSGPYSSVARFWRDRK